MNQSMNKAESAKFLGIAIRTLEQYMHDGRLPFVYVRGRTNKRAAFRLEDLESLKREIARPVYPNHRRNIPKRRTRDELFDALSQDLRRLERITTRLRTDLCFTAEVLLEEDGRTKAEAREWVDWNLRDDKNVG